MLRLLCLVLTLFFGASLYFSNTLERVYVFVTLDNQAKLPERFARFQQIFASREVLAGNAIATPVAAQPLALPAQFELDGQRYRTQDYLTKTHTDGLLVLVNGEQVYQQYFGEFTAHSQHISWSLSKSIVSLLFGQAQEMGLIDRQQTVAHWVPELKDSAYGNVSMAQLLKMSSGITFDENYADPESDINRLGKTIVLQGSIIEFLQGFELSTTRAKGDYQYVSTDTQVLAMALIRATGKSLTELTQEWLWQPLNMQRSAYWLVDRDGYELGFGGFTATLADYARIVDMVGNQGVWQGQQIVPLQYVASISSDTANDPNAELLPGWRYGLHWWLPASGGVLGIGVYNQFLHSQQVVCADGTSLRVSIAKLSSDAAYTDDQVQDFRLHMAMFNRIAKQACEQ